MARRSEQHWRLQQHYEQAQHARLGLFPSPRAARTARPPGIERPSPRPHCTISRDVSACVATSGAASDSLAKRTPFYLFYLILTLIVALQPCRSSS